MPALRNGQQRHFGAEFPGPAWQIELEHLAAAGAGVHHQERVLCRGGGELGQARLPTVVPQCPPRARHGRRGQRAGDQHHPQLPLPDEQKHHHDRRRDRQGRRNDPQHTTVDQNQ
ncbi:hypothetical protein [Nocardia araoensis]|uniref:hypothetical protein n=1 Tax=Nocardia araoensis TaxID=228600 RepID=UPI0012F6DD7D|nr:hypothetical protein [Nocardia araoensis]